MRHAIVNDLDDRGVTRSVAISLVILEVFPQSMIESPWMKVQACGRIPALLAIAEYFRDKRFTSGGIFYN